MFLVHKNGFVAGNKMVDGLVPYDFFCEDNPDINLFVFTGAGAPDKPVEQQTLWGFTRLERFEALNCSMASNKKNRGWFQSVNVLTGPAHNGTRTVKFQRVLKIVKHVSVSNRIASKAGYEILTEEGDTYFTLKQTTGNCAQTVIYDADQ